MNDWRLLKVFNELKILPNKLYSIPPSNIYEHAFLHLKAEIKTLPLSFWYNIELLNKDFYLPQKCTRRVKSKNVKFKLKFCKISAHGIDRGFHDFDPSYRLSQYKFIHVKNFIHNPVHKIYGPIYFCIWSHCVLRNEKFLLISFVTDNNSEDVQLIKDFIICTYYGR